jgi:hypothetical protein
LNNTLLSKRKERTLASSYRLVLCIKRYERDPLQTGTSSQLFGSESFLLCVTAYLDLSATCTPGQVAPAQCKCYFEVDFRKMTVAEVKRQFGNFVSASGAAHVPRVPKISSFLAANKVVARAGSAQP